MANLFDFINTNALKCNSIKMLLSGKGLSSICCAIVQKWEEMAAKEKAVYDLAMVEFRKKPKKEATSSPEK